MIARDINAMMFAYKDDKKKIRRYVDENYNYDDDDKT